MKYPLLFWASSQYYGPFGRAGAAEGAFSAVGAHPFDSQVDDLCKKEMDLSIQQKLGNGIFISLTRWHGSQDLPSAEEIKKAGGYLGVGFRTNDPYNVFRAKERGMPLEEYVEFRVNEIIERMEELPRGHVWLFCGGEQWDSNGPRIDYMKETVKSKKEAYEFFTEWCTTNKHQLHWKGSKFKDAWDPGIKASIPYLKDKLGDKFDHYCIGGGGACVSDLHYQYEWGLKSSFHESFTGTQGAQTAIAFARGAARQFGGNWVVYHPTHSKPRGVSPEGRGGELEYDEDGRKLGGVSENLLLRCWLVNFFSGSDMHLTYFSPKADWIAKSDKLTLSPHGKNVRRFVDFVEKLDDRGNPYTPVGLLLEHNHGWRAERGTPMRVHGDVTWGCLPYEEGDYMIDNFFDVAFPEHGKLPRPRPWKDAEEKWRMMAGGFDFRPYEFRQLTSSRWGDSFDVILENASQECLGRYKGILLLGDIKADRALFEKLAACVKGGAQAVLNIEQVHRDVYPLLEETLGLKLLEGYSRAKGSVCRMCGQRFEEEPFSYRNSRPSGAGVLCTTPSGDPLVCAKKVEKGTIYLTLPRFLQSYDPGQTITIPKEMLLLGGPEAHFRYPDDLRDENGDLVIRKSALLKIGSHFLDHLIGRFQLIKVEGPPIESVVCRKEDDSLMILLVNNEAADWRGKLRVKGWKGNQIKVRELWTGADISDVIVEDAVPGIEVLVGQFGFGVYHISKK